MFLLPAANLTLRVASETAPAGGWTQIKVYLETPELISQGAIAMDFDPAVFGEIAGVAVFSAAGDAIGYANVQGRHLDARFSAISGGIGQLPDVPVFAVRIAVLPGASTGTKGSIALDATGSDWTNPHNSVYSVSVVPGKLTVGGILSVKDVTQGGGLLPPGTIVRIEGAGFDAGTTLSAEGVAMSPLRTVSSRQMEFTLTGAIELGGKRFHIRNSAGEEIDFFPSPPSTPEGAPPQDIVPHVIIPWRAQIAQSLGFSTGIGRQFIGLLNQTTEPVDVRVLRSEAILKYSSLTTILPGKIAFVDSDPHDLGGTMFISPVPIRMIQYSYAALGTPQFVVSQRIVDPTPPAISLFVASSIQWDWQMGTPAPAPRSYPVSSGGTGAGFTATVSGGDWLTVSPAQGSTPETMTFTANPGSLGPGTYTASVTVTPVLTPSLAGFGTQSSVIPVTLHVYDQPRLFAVAGSTSFTVLNGTLTPPLTATVLSNGNPIPFTVMASTSSGGPWLSVTPSSGTTRTELTFAADPTSLAPGDYTGSLTIVGAGDTIVLPVTLKIFPAVLPIKITSSALLPFVREAGAAEPLGGGQFFSAGPATGSVSASVQTDSGGDWLHAPLIFANGFSAQATVSVTPSGLPPGTYHGTVTVTSSVNGSAQVPVTLIVIPKPLKPPTVSQSSIAITTQAGVTSDPQFITLNSPDGPAIYNVSVDPPGHIFLSTGAFLTPETLKLTAGAQAPGTYYADVTFSTSGGSVTIPATVNVTASPTLPPVLGSIVNAASMRTGAIAPGEIIAVLGSGIGPAPIGLALDANGKVGTKLAETQLLINGIPAPLTYASIGQLNAVVPYEVGTSGTATIQVVSNDRKSEIWEVPLAPSAPAIFTLDGTGMGRAAVLNDGRSVNDPSNPALRGATVQIYATGEGELSPPGITGAVTGAGDVKKPRLEVIVTIAGVAAPVQFAGSAPELVAGVLAVNAIVPQEILPGPSVPVSITIGRASSPRSATIAVK